MVSGFRTGAAYRGNNEAAMGEALAAYRAENKQQKQTCRNSQE
jgi:hypothetical protein